PLDRSTFQSAKLDWQSANEEKGKKRLALVQHLLAIRHREIVPRISGAAFGEAHAADNGLLTASWHMGDGTTLQLIANLSAASLVHRVAPNPAPQLWGNEASDKSRPWSVLGSLAAR